MALRPYLAMCRFIHVSQCATWILQRGPAPDFARAVRGWALNAPAFPFLGFDRALAAFYRGATSPICGRRSGRPTRPRSPVIATGDARRG